MKEAKKQELEMETLSQVAGGVENYQQDNQDNEGVQQNTEKGNNYNDVTQVNQVSNNSGTINIGSPVDIKDVGENSVVIVKT